MQPGRGALSGAHRLLLLGLYSTPSPSTEQSGSEERQGSSSSSALGQLSASSSALGSHSSASSSASALGQLQEWLQGQHAASHASRDAAGTRGTQPDRGLRGQGHASAPLAAAQVADSDGSPQRTSLTGVAGGGSSLTGLAGGGSRLTGVAGGGASLTGAAGGGVSLTRVAGAPSARPRRLQQSAPAGRPAGADIRWAVCGCKSSAPA